MSATAELEQLQKRRTELENAWKSMEQKEKTLGENIKILEEKLAVQALEEKIKAKNAALAKLESTKSDLEKKLQAPQEKPKPSPSPTQKPPAPQPAQAQ